MRLKKLNCCAVQEISGISSIDSKWRPGVTPKSILDGYLKRYGKPSCAFLIFTQAGYGATYGDKFAEFVEAEKLGTVTSDEPARNPNSGRPVKVFNWTIDQERFFAYAAKVRSDYLAAKS